MMKPLPRRSPKGGNFGDVVPISYIFLSAYLGHFKEGLGAWACAGIVMIAVRTRWELRGRAWFWMIVVFAILVQVPFVLLVPWDNRHLSFISLLPAGVLDYAIVYCSFKLAEKIMKRSDSTSSPS